MKNIEELYLNEEKRNRAIRSLISFGTSLFKSAYIIENLTTLENILKNHVDNPRPNQKLVSELEPFIWQKLVDDIKIVTGFENVMKSQLIFKNFIVHKIEGDFKNKQSNSPIESDKIKTFHNDGNSLTKFTLNVSTILNKPNYYDQLSISDNIRKALINMNDGRNQLHLLETFSTSFSLDQIESMKLMNSYIDHLIEKLKGSA